MPEPPQNTDPAAWHRYFGMECNNRAWSLVEKARTAAEDDEMLDLAHAAAWHWQAVGTDLNRARARMLLAEVHAQLGLGRSAYAYASEVRAYFLGRQTDDWELAFTHAIHAHAAHAAGHADEHRSSYAEAVRALEAIADPEDRAIVQRTFDLVPAS